MQKIKNKTKKQRREDIAKDLLVALYGNERIESAPLQALIRAAVAGADRLLAELDK